MRKRISLILTILSMMLLFSINSPISYAQTPDDMSLEIQVIGSHKPEKDQVFTIYIESNDVSYPMPAGSINGRYAINILGEEIVQFPEIDFDQIGEYSYRIYQFIDKDNESYAFDDTVYELFAIVTMNEETQELETHYNLYIEYEDDKTDQILFVNEYVRDTLADFIPPEPKEPPKKTPAKPGLPLTGSVDVYYMLGFASVLVGVLITALRKVRE